MLEIKQKMIKICDSKIAKNGIEVGISFYIFFGNENNNSKLLMEVATWWIETHKLNHFEKATKIKNILLSNTTI